MGITELFGCGGDNVEHLLRLKDVSSQPSQAVGLAAIKCDTINGLNSRTLWMKTEKKRRKRKHESRRCQPTYHSSPFDKYLIGATGCATHNNKHTAIKREKNGHKTHTQREREKVSGNTVPNERRHHFMWLENPRRCVLLLENKKFNHLKFTTDTNRFCWLLHCRNRHWTKKTGYRQIRCRTPAHQAK